MILEERKQAKYSIISDATPDSAHQEQTILILRYVHKSNSNRFDFHERLLEFINCSAKTGEAIAGLLKSTLEKHKISIQDCRGQGYDNAANMSGKYKGAQMIFKQDNPLATYSPCGVHTLNLIGNEAAECCNEAVKYFGIVQEFYVIFAASPQRWEILKNYIHISIHNLSSTRWSARVDAIRPFVRHIPSLTQALNDVLTLNLTPETRSDILNCLTYVDQFEYILMSNIWHKILTAIDFRNKILQAGHVTLDLEEKLLDDLTKELLTLRDKWNEILSECKIVENNLNISVELPSKRRRTNDYGGYANLEERFKVEVFFLNFGFSCWQLEIRKY